MNRHLAHLLRRTARKLIAWSNRLDAPAVTNDLRWVFTHNGTRISRSEYETRLQSKDYGRLQAQMVPR